MSGDRKPDTGLAVSADNRWLATTSGDTIVRLWNAATGEPAAEVRFPVVQGICPAMQSVAYSPDGKPLRVLDGHTELVYGLDFLVDGSRLASSSPDQTVRVWHPESGKSLLTIPFPVQVYGVKCSPTCRKRTAPPC